MEAPESPPGAGATERPPEPAAPDPAVEAPPAAREAAGAPSGAVHQAPAEDSRAVCPRCGDFAGGGDLLTFWNGKSLCALCCERLMAPELVTQMREDPGFTFQATGLSTLGWLIALTSILGAIALMVFVTPGLFLLLLAALSLIPLLGFSFHESVRFVDGRIHVSRRGLSDIECDASNLERYVFFGALDRDERKGELAITLSGPRMSRRIVRLTAKQKELRWMKTILELP